MPIENSNKRPKWLNASVLRKVVIAIVAAWIPALVAAAAGIPLSAVLVLALIISGGVFRLLVNSEPSK
jgi:hypothetical protein